MNPYDWKRNQPSVEVSRPETGAVAVELHGGGSGVLLAGRGMGKSVFLKQLREELERRDDTDVVLFHEPPAEFSVSACLETLARRLVFSDKSYRNMLVSMNGHRTDGRGTRDSGILVAPR